MILTLLNSGTAYLQRISKDKVRAHLPQVALGSASGYTVAATQQAFLATPLLKTDADLLSLVGDAATFTVVLDADVVATFGEIAILSPTGVFVAMYVNPSPIVKAFGTFMTLTLTFSYTGLSALLNYASNTVSLSRTRVDYDSALVQLKTAALKTNNFNGLAANETGNVLLELLAGVVDFDSAMVESAYQETFPDLAKLDSSQYAIQAMLRNRLIRKDPSSVTVTLTRTGALSAFTVPQYTQFTSGSVQLFNRDALLFGTSASITVTLYEGTVKQLSTTGNGTDYQFFISDEKDFTVSNQDVQVTVGARSIPVVTDPLWNYSGKDAVQDFTTKLGQLILFFGNSLLATSPQITETVFLAYTVTTGTTANNAGFSGQRVACSLFGQVSGVATSALSGGGDNPPITFYQRLGGDLYGGNKGAVTRNQYTAKAREYPGVLDAIVKGQRDLAPTDYRWFNTAKVILLTSSVWSATNKADFTAWFQQRTMYSMRYVVLVGVGTDEPRKRLADVSLKVFCTNSANLLTVQSAVQGSITQLFAARAGILSRDIHVTDITDAALSSSDGIDYLDVVLPSGTPGTIVSDITAPVFSSISIGVGTLANGSYQYSVTAIDADGETDPLSCYIAVTSGSGAAVITWLAKPGATSYKVYGRTAASQLTIWSGTALTYTDTGAVTPVAPLVPSINTSGVHYPFLNNLTVVVDYSQRRSIV